MKDIEKKDIIYNASEKPSCDENIKEILKDIPKEAIIIYICLIVAHLLVH